MPVLARRLPGGQELHVDVEAALLGVHLLIDDVLDQAVGRALERHVGSLHQIQPARVLLAKFLRRLERFGVEIDVARLGVGARPLARIDDAAHLFSYSAASLRAAFGGRSGSSALYVSSMRGAMPCLASSCANIVRISGRSSA